MIVVLAASSGEARRELDPVARHPRLPGSMAKIDRLAPGFVAQLPCLVGRLRRQSRAGRARDRLVIDHPAPNNAPGNGAEQPAQTRGVPTAGRLKGRGPTRGALKWEELRQQLCRAPSWATIGVVRLGPPTAVTMKASRPAPGSS